ncbi:hypothetical protein [Catenovulum agarivorans]|uniref:hypothetical protein n=1 Tax=Catenovulum agarivorans TaxID=1172192 RepID=UPI00031F2037|nr:hypothetical protein [Catenovulum agarivorans]
MSAGAGATAALSQGSSNSTQDSASLDYYLGQNFGGIDFGGGDDKGVIVFSAAVFTVAVIAIVLKKRFK